MLTLHGSICCTPNFYFSMFSVLVFLGFFFSHFGRSCRFHSFLLKIWDYQLSPFALPPNVLTFPQNNLCKIFPANNISMWYCMAIHIQTRTRYNKWQWMRNSCCLFLCTLRNIQIIFGFIGEMWNCTVLVWVSGIPGSHFEPHTLHERVHVRKPNRVIINCKRIQLNKVRIASPPPQAPSLSKTNNFATRISFSFNRMQIRMKISCVSCCF